MSEETPRKKLTLNNKRTASPDTQKIRTGARARHVAIQAIQRQVAQGVASAIQEKTRRASTDKPRHKTGIVTHSHQKPQRKTHHNHPDARFALNPDFVPPSVYPSYQEEVFPVFAPCPIGLEQALVAELEALGFKEVNIARSGCSFKADWKGIMRANLYSRLATRILVQLAHANVETEDDIYTLARNVAWERWFGAEKTLRVDTSAIRSPMRSLQFCNLRTKDAIVDHLRHIEGQRPSIDTVRPDAKVHLFLDSQSATLYLDTSGESLFKRGWRYDKGQAPLRENLAAGILALAGWQPHLPLLDPFCGSGTILIEAAWIAKGIPPGLYRPFSFERLRGMNHHVWAELKEQAHDHIQHNLTLELFGSDIDERVIQAAQSNLHRAQLTDKDIHFSVANALNMQVPCTMPGHLISNPPYGERLGAEDTTFWREWSSTLKNQFSQWQVSIITNDMDFPKKLRLKPHRRTPIFNGDIECRLFGFEMVSDSYR